MKTGVRIFITFFVVLTVYFFIVLVPFSFIPAGYKIFFLPNIIALIIAILAGIYVWNKTKNVHHGLATSILLGGIILGALGFIAGFVGPLIFTPENNLGPLLGIFYTGPIGFIVGLIAGGLYWKFKTVPRQL